MRKITRAIEMEIFEKPLTQVFICLEEKRYLDSKPYQKFMLNYSNSVSRNFEEMAKEEANFLEMFELDGKTIFQVFNSTLPNISVKSFARIIGKYITGWNKIKALELKSQNFSLSYQIIPLQVEKMELISKVDKIRERRAELVNRTPFDLTFEDKNKLQDVENQMQELSDIIKTSTTGLTQLVEKSTQELAQTIRAVEERLNEVSQDIKVLLPTEKIKHKPRTLRDPIKQEVFQLLIFSAGSNSS
jgi:hypothetical protein